MLQTKAAVRSKTANEIRNLFLEYFNAKNHKIIRSSPVLPHKDPSLAFVNAGMNQFKGVFLGTVSAPYPRVVNVQKCVRVGGKHNDLDDVGRDHTHHTFFEMLGNWSFNDYYKADACSMAWDLLTNVYEIPKERLHVTYFGGDKDLKLPADHETRDIWKSIGVADSKIKPMPLADNFWQMAETGPCGVCTEIHCNGIEIWNLVFMEYTRCRNGLLHPLDKKHVDTGMGLERLVSLLQGRQSTYDTDLFLPLLNHIKKYTRNIDYKASDSVQDCAFRILADHCRMLAVTLSDGFYPHDDSKVRHILRRTITAQKALNIDLSKNILSDLCCIVAEILGPVYPELERNLSQVCFMINEEVKELEKQASTALLERWKKLRDNDLKVGHLSVEECPNLLTAYLKVKNKTELTLEEAWKICESFGVPVHLIPELASALGVTWNQYEFEKYVIEAKAMALKNAIESEKKSCLSDDTRKWLLMKPSTKTRAIYKNVEHYSGKILGIIACGISVEKIQFSSPQEFGLLLDRTNMYPEGGGQECDLGTITCQDGLDLHVKHVENIDGRILHWITHNSSTLLKLSVGDSCQIRVDMDRRQACSCNHTGTHLLQAAVKKVLPSASGKLSQKSSKVSSSHLVFHFSIYRHSLGTEDIERVESLVQKVIAEDIPLKRYYVDPFDLQNISQICLLPGVPYLHKKVSVVEFISPLITSREPCCGTHVGRTSAINSVIITSFKSASTGAKSIRAVTGYAARTAIKRGRDLEGKISGLTESVNHAILNPNTANLEGCDKKLTDFVRSIHDNNLKDTLPWVVAQKVLKTVADLRERLRIAARNPLRKSMAAQMDAAVANNLDSYLVLQLVTENQVDTIPLEKATRMCPDKPCLIVKSEQGIVKARCCVPEKIYKLRNVSAEKWLKSALDEIGGGLIGAPKHQQPELVCNLKGRKLTPELLKKFLQAARNYAVKHF